MKDLKDMKDMDNMNTSNSIDNTDPIKDVIVIGAGIAGLSAAINVRQRGGSVLVIGLPMEDNPLFRAEKVNNYPGLQGVTGKELLEAFTAHAASMGVDMVRGRVLSASIIGDNWMVSAGSDIYQSRAVVFAGGVGRGKPYPGESEHLGNGVSYCATCDGMFYRGKKVVVIGFGPSDREEAEYLEGIGCQVTYLEKPRSVEIIGEGRVTGVVTADETIEADGVFVLRPSIAPSMLFGNLELEGGYVVTDKEMKTSLPGLFAAGDCTGKPLQVAKAAGDGLVAGQNAADYAKEKRKK